MWHPLEPQNRRFGHRKPLQEHRPQHPGAHVTCGARTEANEQGPLYGSAKGHMLHGDSPPKSHQNAQTGAKQHAGHESIHHGRSSEPQVVLQYVHIIQESVGVPGHLRMVIQAWQVGCTVGAYNAGIAKLPSNLITYMGDCFPVTFADLLDREGQCMRSRTVDIEARVRGGVRAQRSGSTNQELRMIRNVVSWG